MSRIIGKTRWHTSPEDMLFIDREGATPLAEAKAEERAAIGAVPVPPIEDKASAVHSLREADPRILLMCLVHLTGDETLLDRFGGYMEPEAAGGLGAAVPVVPAEVHAELAERVAERLAAGGSAAEKPVSLRLLQRMLGLCVGETLGDEFLPFLLEQCGFTGTQGYDEQTRATPPEGFKMVIIGAGLSGIALGAKLGAFGYDYEIIERNPDVGGTWWINRYPGVGVDTPSHYYSYSFDAQSDWPKYFSSGAVLLDYFRQAAERFGVRDHISFETEALGATYDEASATWAVRVRDSAGGERSIIANAIVPAINFTCMPSIPSIPGAERFKGPMLHTADWDPAVDLAGKRVAVIGTGASSMQICTAIAPEVEQLTIFQRSKHWIVRAPLVGKMVEPGVAWAMRNVPHYAQYYRFVTLWGICDGIYPVVVTDPSWDRQDVSISPANEALRQMLLGFIHSELEGRPDLIAKVTPDYPPFGKRIILDHGWFKMLRRDNVELEVSGIRKITEDAIITNEGRRIAADVIVYSTGFAFRPMLANLQIIGRNNASIHDVWGDENPHAYLGILVAGFPNLFVMNGPNSAPTHGAGQNLIAEGAANYILGLLDMIVRQGGRAVEVRPEAMEEYVSVVDEALAKMVWSHPKASSYYINKDRRNTVSCPWRLVDYWWMLRTPVEEDLIIS